MHVVPDFESQNCFGLNSFVTSQGDNHETRQISRREQMTSAGGQTLPLLGSCGGEAATIFQRCLAETYTKGEFVACSEFDKGRELRRATDDVDA